MGEGLTSAAIDLEGSLGELAEAVDTHIAKQDKK
jgi:hypothetical protein